MTVVLAEDQIEIIHRGMKTGLYPSEEAVIIAALKSLAEDWKNLTLIQERSSEARSSLAIVESEVQGAGRLA